jgi:hypothetical protein
MVQIKSDCSAFLGFLVVLEMHFIKYHMYVQYSTNVIDAKVFYLTDWSFGVQLQPQTAAISYAFIHLSNVNQLIPLNKVR